MHGSCPELTLRNYHETQICQYLKQDIIQWKLEIEDRKVS